MTILKLFHYEKNINNFLEKVALMLLIFVGYMPWWVCNDPLLINMHVLLSIPIVFYHGKSLVLLLLYGGAFLFTFS